MSERIAAIDAYIGKAQPFARPILEYLRDVVHAACPDVEEKIKWGFPHFDYRGMLCSMAAFKAHAAFGFWKHGLLVEQAGLVAGLNRGAMGSFGRTTSRDELPPRRVLVALVRHAMRLNEEGVKNPARSNRAPKPAIRPPAAFTAALARNRKARATYDGFPPGQRREYLEWITEAKTAETRERRMATAIEWMAEGKRRNWKHEKPKRTSAPAAAPRVRDGRR
jgi:hypothetical protein